MDKTCGDMHIIKELLETLLLELNRASAHRVECLATDLTTLATARQPYVELYLVTQGVLEMHVADKAAVVEAGSVVLAGAFQGNRGVPARGAEGGFRYDVVSFDCFGVPALAAYGRTPLLETHPLANPEALDALFREACRRYTAPPSDLKAVFLKLAALRLLQCVHQELAPPPTGRQALLDNALRLMDRRLGDPALEAREIACELHVSASYLGRLFREELGDSPLQALLRRRLERAKLQLRHSVLNVKEIAFAAGFRDQLYFSRLFRRKTGKSPLEFRNSLNR